MRLRRSTVTLGVATLLSVGMVSGLPPSAVGEASDRSSDRLREGLAAAQAQAELRTPFETSNGARFTTVDEAERFWRDLDAASERVRVDRVGRTVQGRPLQLVQVGAPEPRPLAEAEDGSVALFICSQHGDEPAGREACLQLARDMASTDDPAWERTLRRTTVLFINANPDGWAANTRENADGVDINRDYLELATREGRAVAALIRDWKPDVLNDLHEYGPREYYDTDLLHLWPRNRNVDDTVYRLSKRMNNAYAAPQVERLGYRAGVYGQLVKDGVPFQQVAGDEQARILRNYTGLQHTVGMLTETADAALTPEEQADPALRNRRRVEVEYASATGTMQMVLENRRRLARQTAGAERRSTQAGPERSGVVYFAGQDDMLPTSSSEVEPEPMCGYQLTRDQLREVRRTLRGHGIGWDRSPAGAFVTMAQADRPLIPLLLDERSEYGLVEAIPVDTC